MQEHRPTILLVEDDTAHVEMIQRVFALQAGHQRLLLAPTLHEARMHLAAQVPDLVIADWLLPDGNGIELIPSSISATDYPVVLMTSHGNEQVAVEAILAGALDYVGKSSSTLTDLPRIADRAMRQWRLIVERRRAEEALQESEARYRALVDGCFHGMFIHHHGIIQFANAALATTFGYDSPEELIGHDYRILVAPHEHERMEDYRTARLRGEPIPSTYEFQGVRKDGTVIWLASIVAKVPWHSDVAIMATVLNIDERKRMEDELHTLSYAIEQSPSMIAITDIHGTVEYVNATFTQETGYTRDDVVGSTLLLPPFLANASEDLVTPWQKLAHTAGWQGEWVATRKNGGRYREFMSITPVRNRAGIIAHCLVVKDDISEDMRIQQRLSQAERLASLGTLAAGLGHELNQPLTAIRVTVDSLLYGMRRGWSVSEERLAESLQLIAEQCHRAVTILDDIRTFARDDPKRHTDCGIVHTGIERVLRMIGTQVKVHGIELHEQVPPTLPPVALSQAHLEQVLLNLITNARQALDTIDHRAKCIVITAQQAGTAVVLHVEDNGPGIEPEVQARLFDPFFTTKEPGEGTGLGLSIVHSLVTEAGGEVSVSARPAGGVIFTVCLPVAES